MTILAIDSNLEELAQRWLAEGVVDLGPILPASQLAEFQQEARSLRAGSKKHVREESRSYRDGSMATPTLCHVISAGPALHALLTDKSFLLHLRQVTQLSRLIPVRCGYNYYEPGDYMGVHRDSYKASATISIPLAALEPMGMAPQLRDLSNEQIFERLNEQIYFPSADEQTLDLEVGHVYLFDGYNVPHWRSRVTKPGGMLGNMCYFNL